ncbi:MAG: serine/threonine-protein kinase, partial [Planctomycetota bacterium]
MAHDPYTGKTIGPFLIGGKLGEGGMGAVYRAVHRKLDREVAFKILPDHLVRGNPVFVDRFFVEARAAARVDHLNVVRVYDADETDGVYYIAMEFVPGVDLKDLLEEKSPLEELEAVEIVLQAAQGLNAAAKQKIIHRDIKPANLMITREGVVKVADFGLAKNVDAVQQITQSGQIMGTPSYMSPEQAEGSPTDFRTDIYSLGVTFFESVAGVRPFHAETPLGLLRKHCDAPIPNPASFNSSLSPKCCALIERMMAKKPEARFHSYNDLVQALASLRSEIASREPETDAMAGVGQDQLTILFSAAAKKRKAKAQPDVTATMDPEPTPVTAPPPQQETSTPAQVTVIERRGVHPLVWLGGFVVLLVAVAAL